jgi:hypothetical protein
MADHAIALATPLGGPSPDESGLIFEDVAVTGTGGTTGTYTTNFVKQPLRVLGSFFTVTFSGQVGTFASAAFTGIKYVRILGFG